MGRTLTTNALLSGPIARDPFVAGELSPCASGPDPESALPAALRLIAQLQRDLRDRDATIEALQEELRRPCSRCAQIGHGLELMQQRARERQAHLFQLERDQEQHLATIATLKKRLAELEQKRHRSAAPFRREEKERVQTPKRAGAKDGHAPHYRRVPEETPVQTVEVPLDGCPTCGGEVTDQHPIEQTIVELPPVTPIYYRLLTQSGLCARCGRVRSTHPLQGSGACGAAGVQLGPRAQAIAVELRHSYGLPTRRVCGILDTLFHLPLTPGGLCQLLVRVAGRLRADVALLRDELRDGKAVHADETSWWLLGMTAWLWVLATERTTLYHISEERNTATLEGLLGETYGGTLISDCLNIYDKYAAATKSKCVCHHMRAIGEAQETVKGSAFLGRIMRLMGAALKLQRYQREGKLPAEVYERGVASLEERLTKLLSPKYQEKEEERIANRFRKRREEILTFLHDPEIAATNNLAERQLRPAVITRKLSCGNKTEKGARSWEVLASLAATCRQRGVSFVAFVANRLMGGEVGVPDGAQPAAGSGHG